jgi:adenylate cyclase
MFNLNTKDILNLRKKAQFFEGSIKLKNNPLNFWKYIMNNELVSQKSGKAPTKFSHVPDYKGLFLLKGVWKLSGLDLEYYELPYEWVYPSYITGEIVYVKGPFRYIVMDMSFSEPEANQYYFNFKFKYVPTIPFFGKYFAGIFFKNSFKVYQKLDRIISPDTQYDLQAFSEDNEITREKAANLAKKWHYLKPGSPVPDKLALYIYTSPEQFISKIRPFDAANKLKLDPLDVLIFCLLATRAGFLNLSWDLLCPGCRVTSLKAGNLSEIDTEEHCDSCNIRFDVDFDKNVEITFSPHENIRPVVGDHFCLGSPSNTPHIYSQVNVGPESSRTIELNFSPGKYRIRCLTMKGEIFFEVPVDSRKTEFSLELTESFPVIKQLEFAKKTTLVLNNPEDNWKTIKVDNLFYLDFVTTAHFVTCLQDFRDSFGSQVLRPGIKMGISNLVVLFSDLKDSTLLYETKGDAAAFSLVQDHFAIMTEVIRENKGGIVKTIGDSVMAVFTNSPDAIRASIRIMEEFDKWNRETHSSHNIIINLGLHEGPCLALNLNDRLDYFGSTVNKAARIQGTSKDGNLVLSENIYKNPEVQEIIKNKNAIRVTSFYTNLKGIEGDNILYKLSLDKSAGSKPLEQILPSAEG